MKSEDGLGKVLSDLHVLLMCNSISPNKVNKSLLQEAGNRGSTSLGNCLYVGGPLPLQSPILKLFAKTEWRREAHSVLAVRLGLSAKEAVCSVDSPFFVAARRGHLDPEARIPPKLVEFGIDGLVDVAGDRIITCFAFRHMVLPNTQQCSVHEGRR